MKLNNAIFVVFEGTDGCGKSTMASAIYDALVEKGIDTLLTSEPFMYATQSLYSGSLENYLKDRNEHHEWLLSKIEKRNGSNPLVVLCDRYTPSSYAYYETNEESFEQIKKQSYTPDIIVMFNKPDRETKYSDLRANDCKLLKELFADPIDKIIRVSTQHVSPRPSLDAVAKVCIEIMSRLNPVANNITQPSVDKHAIAKILDGLEIENYTIQDDGTVDVDGDVSISVKGLTEMPVQFGVITGSFYCIGNKLTSLEGCPVKIGGNFDFAYNIIRDLSYFPQHVGGWVCSFGNYIDNKDKLYNGDIRIDGKIYSEGIKRN